MSVRMHRRDVLRGLVLFTAAASGSGYLSGCVSDETVDPALAGSVFPQGVASGDPRPDRVILWTRVEPEGSDPVSVRYEVAEDEAFEAIVAEGELELHATSDHTLRLEVSGLSAYKTYYYRFEARGAVSPIGRTKTAPAADAEVSPRFAVMACQDFNGRYFHAYKALLEESPDIDFVVHLGDYVYETDGDPRFQDPTGERAIQLPDGQEISDGDVSFRAAVTLADYRALYKQYRADPDLQEVHRLYPFICVWDDHEFADDAWQSHTTYFNEAQGDENDPARRHAASRAWFEYQPAAVDFSDDASPPDDLAIHRKLRYGKHVELVLTDQRSYRSDHVIPEGPSDPDVGKIGENTSLGARYFVLKSGFDPKEAEAKPTMLGEAQRTWLTDALTQSTATWKLWCSPTQLAQMAVDLSEYDLPDSYKGLFYLNVDQWDGYRSERASILSAIAGTPNVVVLTGDIHSFYASELHPDFDAPADPVAVEYVMAGVSSSSLGEIIEELIGQDEVLTALGLLDLVPKADDLLRAACPHYRYTKTRSYGCGIVEVDGESEVRVTLLHIADPTKPDFGGVASRVKLRTRAGTNRVELL